jgi:hypothetical protein
LSFNLSRLKKWKIKKNCTMFFFLSTWITPWVICYNIMSKTLKKYNFSLATWKFVFKLKSSPIFTFNMVTKTLWWPTCFYKESNFGTKMLFQLLICVQILHFTWITLPSKPNIDSTHKSSLFNYLRSAYLTNRSSSFFSQFQCS